MCISECMWFSVWLCMNVCEWVCECMGLWLCVLCVNVYICECMWLWVCDYVNECVNVYECVWDCDIVWICVSMCEHMNVWMSVLCVNMCMGECHVWVWMCECVYEYLWVRVWVYVNVCVWCIYEYVNVYARVNVKVCETMGGRVWVNMNVHTCECVEEGEKRGKRRKIKWKWEGVWKCGNSLLNWK